MSATAADDSPIIHIHSVPEYMRLIEENRSVIFKATASWCGPCKQISPFFLKFARQHASPGTVAFAEIDIEEVDALVQEFGISSVPTFIAFEDEDKTESVQGAKLPALQKLVNDVAGRAKAKGSKKTDGQEEAAPPAEAFTTGEDF